MSVTAFADLIPLYVESMQMRQFSPKTVETQQMLMRWFITFCTERGVIDAAAVTRAIVERYQRHVWMLRVRNNRFRYGEVATTPHPLSIRGQHGRLWAVMAFFRWAVRAGHLESSPAVTLELPRLPQPLPQPALSVEEVERILAMPAIETANGLRDRAILELLYATGIRRTEAMSLTCDCIDRERGVVRIEQGKGRKGRIVPISQRALLWLECYMDTVWSRFPQALTHRHLFISVDDVKKRRQGRPLRPHNLTRILGSYVAASGVQKSGACHIFRHTAATLMMEHGADMRAIQELLGHANLKTTGIYTNVSLKFLKEQHAKTHPSAFAPGGAETLPPTSPK